VKPHYFLLFFIVAKTLSAQTYNYYFGNIHAHTGFSDGNQDSLISGISTPAGAYAFAKNSQNFDFLGISEHNHYSSNNNPGFEIQNWSRGLNQADAANEEGNFLCFFGMEWGVSSNYNGHVLIYGYPQLIGWESPPGSPSVNYQVYNAKNDYDALFRKVKNQPDAFLTLAHPGLNDYSTAGTAESSLLNSPYNSAYDSAIVGTPLRNGIYNSATTDYTAYPTGNYFEYYRLALAKGYHLGMTYDHDNHNSTFGRATAGRLVILAPQLTRYHFYDAMKKMRFYGSDDWNAKVDFKVNGKIMGSIFEGDTDAHIQVVHSDPDGELADSIKIWKGISKNAVLPSVISITKQSNAITFVDTNLSPENEYYYFAEIKQMDGQWIVTSPVWYKQTLVSAVKENCFFPEFNFFPNPVSRRLSISAAIADDYKISILDVSGRIIYQAHYKDKDYGIDLSDFSQGIYTLKLENSRSYSAKKLVVE
jgi:hypothetical protein